MSEYSFFDSTPPVVVILKPLSEESALVGEPVSDSAHPESSRFVIGTQALLFDASSSLSRPYIGMVVCPPRTIETR